jgi:hypothetical protein
VNWTKNVSFNQDANPAKVVKGVNVYEMSVDTFSRRSFPLILPSHPSEVSSVER